MIFEIISVGRSHWENGFTYALDACKILIEKGFEFHYSIIGAANDMELQYQVHDLNLKNHVTLVEEKSSEMINDRIKNADLLLQPNIKNNDVKIILKAVAMETLVLSTGCLKVDSVISHEVNGFITPIRSPTSLVANIIKIQSLSEEKKTDIKLEALKKIIH